MNREFQLKLQARLDGELPASERDAVEERLKTDGEARSLLREMEFTRSALAGGELPRPLPETREFYWSKIEREISRQESAARRDAAPSGVPWWKRWLVPATSLTVLMLAFGLAVNHPRSGGNPYLMETALTDSGALTFRDTGEGITLVWLSYPAEWGLADANETDIID